jgi:uncharacterized membrane protein (DUF4010 family)
VTLTFARLSATHHAQAAPLAIGAVLASTVMFVRVAIAVAILNVTLLPILARYLAAPFVVALVTVGVAWRSLGQTHSRPSTLKNPLQLLSAVEMALLFQAVLFAVFYIREWVGDLGLLASGFVLGLTDVDALTLSMTRSVASGTTINLACRAIAIGVVANSLMKAGIAVALGDARFKWQAGLSLAAIAAAGTAGLFLF